MKVLCHNADQGCSWSGLLKDIDVSTPPTHNPFIQYMTSPPSLPSPPLPQLHMEECGFKKIKCDLCHEGVLARYLEQHMANECPERTISCGYCSASVISKALQVGTQRHCHTAGTHLQPLPLPSPFRSTTECAGTIPRTAPTARRGCPDQR